MSFTSTRGIFLFLFFLTLNKHTTEQTHQDNLGLPVIPPPKKEGQAWCKSNSKPSQTTLQMTDPVTNPKQKAMVRDNYGPI